MNPIVNTPFEFRKAELTWQLRHRTLVLVLGLAYIAGLLGDDWPLPISTTAINLLVLVVLIGVHCKSPTVES